MLLRRGSKSAPILNSNLSSPCWADAFNSKSNFPARLAGEVGDSTEPADPAPAQQGTWADTIVLCQHPVYMLALLANCPNTGVFGAFAYLGPKASAPCRELVLLLAELA